jgi:hypothetical protein
MFRTAAPAPGTGGGYAALYLLALLPVPVLVPCLLLGYRWARPTLAIFLWAAFGLTAINAGLLWSSDTQSAIILTPFLIAAIIALRFVHGCKLKSALLELAGRRDMRWGPGFGWMLILSSCAIVAVCSAVVLLAIELGRLAGLQWIGPIQWLPLSLGGALSAFALFKMPRTHGFMRWLLAGTAAYLVFVVVRSGYAGRSGGLASTAIIFDGFAAPALSRPTLASFYKRQREKSAPPR